VIRRTTTFSVGGRAAAGLVAGAVLLGSVAGNGLAVEHQRLPSSVAQLTTAVIASGDVLTCYQGVQDDLYIDAVGDFDSASVAAASRRLHSCPTAAAIRADNEVVLPDQPLLDLGAWTRLRSAVSLGQTDLKRAALDIRATGSTMTRDLVAHRHGQAMVIAYDAAYADFVSAGAQDSLARVLLARLQRH
jgi:hypothetical protein